FEIAFDRILEFLQRIAADLFEAFDGVLVSDFEVDDARERVAVDFVDDIRRRALKAAARGHFEFEHDFVVEDRSAVNPGADLDARRAVHGDALDAARRRRGDINRLSLPNRRWRKRWLFLRIAGGRRRRGNRTE